MGLRNKTVKVKTVKAKFYREEKHIALPRLLTYILVFALIGSYFIWRSFAAETLVASVEAESMTLSSGSQVLYNVSGASGSKLVKMSLNGSTITKTVSLGSSSDAVEVTARTNACYSSWPVMSVLVDNALVSTNTVNTSTLKAFRTPRSLSAGSHTLSIKLANQTSCPYLYVDVSKFLSGTSSTTTPAATATISASPASVDYNTGSTLSWSSTNATSCTASGAWSGIKSTSGAAPTGPLTASKTYTLTCSGAGGSSAPASTTVTIKTAATTSYVMRGIFDNATYHYGLNSQPGLGFTDTWASPTKTDLDKIYAKVLPNGQHMKAWLYVGTFSKSTCNFNRSDTTVKGYLTSTVVSHPATNHRYYIVDDTQSGGSTCPNMLTTVKSRTALIHSLDPKAIVGAGEYRPTEMAKWKGVVDELWLDGYPNQSYGYEETRISDQAKAAEAAGMPYLGVIDVSNANCAFTGPVIPSASTLHHMFDQWRATKMRGYAVFHWRYPTTDCSPTVWLQNHPELLDQLKKENAI